MSPNLAARDQGSLTLELALAIPVLLLLTLGSLFVGLLYMNQATLQSAAVVGARSASYDGGDFTGVEQDIANEVFARYMGDPNAVEVTLTFMDAEGNVTYSNSYSLQTPAVDWAGASAGPGERIRVKVSYPGYSLDIPFMTSSQIDLSGTAVARNAAP